MAQLPELLLEKHAKYFRMCLTMLPSKYQSEDNNRLSLIYFSLHGLKLINQLTFTETERHQFAQFIVDQFLVDDCSGFRASSNFAASGTYDKPNVSSTFFALASLALLEASHICKLDRKLIIGFLRSCQVAEGPNAGAFCPTVSGDDTPFGESDMRICYMAAGIRHMLKCDTVPLDDDINVSALSEYVAARIGYNGGISSNVNTEGHLGFTYCGLATLKLLNVDLDNKFDKTANWVLHRQINYPDPIYESVDYGYYRHEDYGGLNGRENKLGDNCYSWWGLGSLAMLGKTALANLEQNANFLLMNQNRVLGGFSKDFDSNPDPYHTFLSIASLALIKQTSELGYAGEQQLQGIEPVLTIAESSKEFLNSIEW